jgi:hypothetical protein
MPGGVAPDRKHLGSGLQLIWETELVAVARGADGNTLLPRSPLLVLISSGAAPTRSLKATVNRRQLLAGQHQLLGDRIVPRPIVLALELDGVTESQNVEQAFDQLEVLHILARDKMEDQVAICPAVPPRFVRFQPGSCVAGATRRLPMTYVDDAPVVEITAPGAVSLDDVVVAVVGGQLKVLPGVEQPAVVLSQTFSIGAQLSQVPLSPESPQVGCTPLAFLPVELPQHTV